MKLEVWLYGPLARYAKEQSQGSYAVLRLEMSEGVTMRDLLERLDLPPEEKGITFVNAELTDMPGLGADLDRTLEDGDRIGLFHRQSMWPFQYRFGAAASDSLREASERKGGALRHAFTTQQEGSPTPPIDR